nr:MAG TPA: transcription factor E2-alpha [Caudoviricetes sp.]DAK87495.1 MAG TPA: Transcription factor [Bacteriophage sp.]
MLISVRSKKNKVMRFLLFFLGIMIGTFIVILILYPILGDTINYIQDLKKELKDMENKENGNN